MSMGTDKDQDLALRDEDAVNVVGGKRAKAAHKTTWTTLPNQAVASAGVVNTPSRRRPRLPAPPWTRTTPTRTSNAERRLTGNIRRDWRMEVRGR